MHIQSTAISSAMPPLHTPHRAELIDYCLRAVTQREMAATPAGGAGAAAKTETLALKAFFDALSTRLNAVGTAQGLIA